MSIVTFDRRASIDEMAAEVDRRGTVIESLEAQVTSLEADRDHWKRRAEDAIANANARLEERRAAEARMAELVSTLTELKSIGKFAADLLKQYEAGLDLPGIELRIAIREQLESFITPTKDQTNDQS
jgi:chromosome segregation ATPase